MDNRSRLTLLCTDVVDATTRAAEMGAERWRSVLRSHDEVVRSALRAHAGREARSAGDGLLATFTSTTNALHCALAIVGHGSTIGLGVRAGLHTGEVERQGRVVTGLGVDVATRIAGRAAASEVLVSDAVREGAEDSEIEFLSRGTVTVVGVSGRRRVYAATDPRLGGTRLIIVDDHPLWRETLKGLLEHGGKVSVVAEAGSGDEAVEAAERVTADVVLMDIDMPGRDGIDATRAIAEMDGGPKVLMLSSMKERDEVVAAVRAGACGYVLKTAGRDEVADAVRRVHAGELVFPSELTQMVLAELRASGERGTPGRASELGGVASLTARERDVLGLIAEGASNHAIAKRLHLSAKTIEAHIGAIFMKLGLAPSTDQHRRVQAALQFLAESGNRRGGGR